jgi:hypothetical protein
LVAASVVVAGISKVLLWFGLQTMIIWFCALFLAALLIWVIVRRINVCRTFDGNLPFLGSIAFFVGALGLSLFLIVLELLSWKLGDSVPREFLKIVFVISLASLPVFCFGCYQLLSLRGQNLSK